MDFTGDPTPLGDEDYAYAAAKLGCTLAAIKAVAEVESAGSGFFRDGRPKILFERHIFHRETGGRFTAGHPDISFTGAGGYLGGPREYERLGRAMELDRKAALRSASWGKFQLMGFNHKVVGEDDLSGFIRKMVSGEPAQLDLFVAFIRSARLAANLREMDWEGFARGYNGTDFRRHDYHGRIARAFDELSGGAFSQRPLLRAGDRGIAVGFLQDLLGLERDGRFGSQTEAGVRAFQGSNGLVTDGIVGSATWSGLLKR